MIRSVLGVGTHPEECSWKERSGLAGWLKLLSGMMTMMLYPDVKVIVWAISEKGEKCHKQTLRENKQGKIFAKKQMQLAEEKRDRDDILSFRRKFDLICNVKLLFQPPSFSLRSKFWKQEFHTNFEESPSWQLASQRNIWRGVQFQWINKTSHV